MKPNFNPQRGDIVRVRHHEYGVVDAEYGWPSTLYQKWHRVSIFGEHCYAQKLEPNDGSILTRVRFVYPVECMPDYRKQVAHENNR